MKKRILAAVILIPSTIVGMKEDLSAAKLVTLIKMERIYLKLNHFLISQVLSLKLYAEMIVRVSQI